MAWVKVLGTFTVSSGAKVRLSDAQRKVRAHIPSTQSDNGWEQYGQTLEFKSGEVFEMDGVPKGADLEILNIVDVDGLDAPAEDSAKKSKKTAG